MSFCFPKTKLPIPLKTPQFHFWEVLLGKWSQAAERSYYGGFAKVRKKNFKGRCEKRVIAKCNEVCRTYDAIQYAYADILQASDEVKEIRCNVPLDGRDIGHYTSDFVCVKSDNDLMVRECVFRKFLLKPLTVKLLDASREYWLRHGVTDWGLVIDEEA